MKKQKLILIPALSLAASLALAPIGFASEVSSTPNTVDATSSNQSVAPSLVASPVYKIGKDYSVSEELYLHGEFEIKINPVKYDNFNIKIYDSVGRQVSAMSYSGSSPTTLLKSDEKLVGPHKIAVTTTPVVANAGTFQVNY